MVYKIEISAETKAQADTIMNHLLSLKLMTGGQFLLSPSRFLWKGEVVDQDYCTLTGFTVAEHRQKLVEAVESVSEEEVPMVVMFPFEANPRLESWIIDTVRST